MSTLPQSVYYYPDRVMPFHLSWQVCNEVHGNVVPFPLRNIQRLQHATRPLMLNLRFLTYQTRSDIISTSVFMPVHQKVAFKSLYILVIPGCMLRRLLCPSGKSIFLKTLLLGIHTLSLNRRIPSLPILKSFLFFVPNSLMISCSC